jgi:hypothetical protein
MWQFFPKIDISQMGPESDKRTAASDNPILAGGAFASFGLRIGESDLKPKKVRQD